eukprot:gb/GECG01008495.1/.p1 GENE.gb/GECG01008495.1/~~gb/GECG01008495.1/.p1  ORF type:complete len:553 (+),score=75.64 gb/GECG01008495.1/:1-1659(+)
MVRVQVKWKSDKFEVEFDPTAPNAVDGFKGAICEKTGVPKGRQKLMSKGAWKGVLKDSEDLSKCDIKEGQQVTLMGTSEGVPSKGQNEVVFVEDMKREDQAKHGSVLPSGLVNLGNTCYMNSTLQCLRHVPELRDGLKLLKNDESTNTNDPSGLSKELAQLYDYLDRSDESCQPLALISKLRQSFPQYAEQVRPGQFKQQDSEEFTNLVLSNLARSLVQKPEKLPRLVKRSAGTDQPNVVDTLFGFEQEVQLSCEESGEGPEIKRESDRKLVCNIQGGAGAAVQINHLHEGIQLALEGEVEKHSDSLGRNSVWKKQVRMDQLPKYLCVQLMRFYWKPTPGSEDHAGVSCKMLRPVSFEVNNFDLYDFCSSRVQEVLSKARNKYAKEQLNDLSQGESVKKAKTDEEQDRTMSGNSAVGDEGNNEDDDELSKAIAMSMEGEGDNSRDGAAVSGAGGNSTDIISSEDIGVGLPDDFRGLYELFAIVTHKGRSSNSGHYMGWVRQGPPGNSERNGSDDWLVFDDDEVSPCNTEHIQRLKGGGDDHMAYLLFYRAKC